MMEDFERWWKAYPRVRRKVAKRKCREIWRRLERDGELAPVEEMLETLRWQTKMWRTEEFRFVPMPATYLNQGRWEDEEPLDESPPGLYD